MLILAIGEECNDETVKHIHVWQDSVKSRDGASKFVLDFPVTKVVGRDANKPFARKERRNRATEGHGAISSEFWVGRERLAPFILSIDVLKVEIRFSAVDVDAELNSRLRHDVNFTFSL